ncbi:MAG: cysteine synthase, partial [Phycisphaerae bacterium]|nr:cysteine synthase [Phycisphaerae bacterium]
ISAALAAVFRLVRQANYLMTHGLLHQDDAGAIEVALRSTDAVLGILPAAGGLEVFPAEVQDLVRQRDEARRNKDFTRADAIRRDLAARGYRVEDRSGGPRIMRRS